MTQVRGTFPELSDNTRKTMALHGHHRKPVSRTKAHEIMRHGKVRGAPLTDKQRGLFGLIAGGGTPTRIKAKPDTAARRHAARRKAHGG